MDEPKSDQYLYLAASYPNVIHVSNANATSQIYRKAINRIIRSLDDPMFPYQRNQRGNMPPTQQAGPNPKIPPASYPSITTQGPPLEPFHPRHPRLSYMRQLYPRSPGAKEPRYRFRNGR